MLLELWLVMLIYKLRKAYYLKSLDKGMMKGGIWESGTEALQESTSYIASALGSEAEFNWNEFKNIAKNAAAGGFLMGSTIGGTMSGTSGYGSIKKMQSDYSMATSDASSGFFNYAQDEDGNTLGNAVSANGHVYPKPMTEEQFNSSDQRGNTWEPKLVDVEEINEEMLKHSEVNTSEAQRQVDEQVKLGEVKVLKMKMEL